MTWAEANMMLDNVTASTEYVYILYVHFIIRDGAPNETETSEIVALMTKFIKARPVKSIFMTFYETLKVKPQDISYTQHNNAEI